VRDHALQTVDRANTANIRVMRERYEALERIARLEEAGSEALRLAALNEWRDASLLWHKAKEDKP
jgi:hypothetical protein